MMEKLNMHAVDPATVGMSAQRLVRITDMVQGYIDRGELAGATTMVIRHGQVAYFAPQGMADIGAGRPMSEDAIVRIYSMSKPITVVAALMLYEQGLFGLNDPISAYIPSFKESQVFGSVGDCGVETVPAAEGITIKQLMMHTSGIIYPGGEDEVGRLWEQASQSHIGEDRRPALNTAELIDVIAGLPLAFQPGTQWRYGHSTDVLSRLIEVLSGMTFGEYLQEALFGPLGMVDTAFWVPEHKLGRLTALYSNKGEEALHLEDAAPNSRWATSPRFESGGGGLVSTIGDYARFGQMLANGGELHGVRILGRKTVELMVTDHLPPHVRPTLTGFDLGGYGFALGVAVMRDPTQANVPTSVGEYWWGGAAGTRLHIDPNEGLVGLFMPQLMDGRRLAVHNQFLALMYAALN